MGPLVLQYCRLPVLDSAARFGEGSGKQGIRLMTATQIDAVLASVDAGLEQSLERLYALLRIKSISTDPAYAQECRKAADWIVDELKGLGFDAAARSTPGHPVVVAHGPDQDGAHVLFYAHYDVQPVDPLELWHTDPFAPELKTDANGRKIIVARGASDDKGQMMTFIEACRAWKTVTGGLPVEVTILLEGEEESGSRSLGPFLDAHADELACDLALVCDTGMWNAETPAITTRLRGLVHDEVVVTGPSMDLHSGMFGGPAHNPIHILARIVAALHDANGVVTLPGFYDGVPELHPEQRREWDALGLDEAQWLARIGQASAAGEKGRTILEKIWARPTCDVNGIIGGYTGEGTKTVIPSRATAKVSFRLIGEQDPMAIRDAFRKFVRDHLPEGCGAEFFSHGASPAIEIPADSPPLAKARKALEEEFGRPPVHLGCGGSIPIVESFKRVLGMDSLLIGFGLDDDRIHSPNEKYELSSFRHGTRSWARILAALAE